MANAVDPNHYLIEYTRPGSSEKCNGPPPCNGSTIVLGDLRFGTKKYNNRINDKLQHWGCVTPDILYDLAFLDDVDRIPGVDRLNPSDRLKIHTAVERLEVDKADIPVTARKPVVAKPSLASASQMARPIARPSAAPFGIHRVSAPAPPPTAPKKRKAPATKTPSLPTPALTPTSSQASYSQQPYLQASQYDQHRPAAGYSGQITMTQQQRDDAAYLDDDDYDEEEAQYTDMYLSFQSQVVGIQYYDGLVGPGEQVNLVREPTNKYDRNAIQVMNMRLKQVGHIPRQTAANLAPLIDQNLILVEGTMNDGNCKSLIVQGHQYTLSLTLTIYGKPGIRTMLEPLLTWATPGRRGFTDAMRRESGIALTQTASYSAGSSAGPSYLAGPANNPMYIDGQSSSQPQLAHQRALEMIEAQRRASELRDMLDGLQKIDDEGRRANFLDAIYEQEKQDILNLPEHPSPPGIEEGSLTVDLLKHQKQGLLWCINRESATLPQKDGEPHEQFWEYRSQPGRKGYYINMITKTPVPVDTPPAIGHGGIMSDSMGLGKSLTFLALIIATKKTQPAGYDNPTLIVCPLSVLGNWESQIASHCTRGALSHYTYYSDKRNVDSDVLKAYDVVLTTYQTVTADYAAVGGFKTTGELMAESESRTSKKRKTDKSAKKALFGIQWKRVVLDEAHHIRNPKAKMSQAASALNGYYRWAVSGTPIVNSPSVLRLVWLSADLGSLLTFLRMCTPLDQLGMFNRFLSRPLSKGELNAAVLLKQLMKHISIRRSKEMQDEQGNRLVELPKVTIHVTNVELGEESRHIYDTVERLSRQRFVSMANAAEGESIPNVVLSLLTRMRQIALHPGLVPSDYLDKLRADEAADNALHVAAINPQEKARLQSILFHAEEDSEECAICFDSLRNPRILPDGHYFCYDCIAGYIQTHGAEATCPMDRRPISMTDLIEPAPPTDLTQVLHKDSGLDDFGLASSPGSSPKIDRLIQILKLIPSDDKAVVFSQFTTFLEKIADQLEAHGISFVEFNGAMSAKRRQEVLKRFSVPLAKKSSRRVSAKKQAEGSDSDSEYDVSRDDDYIDEEDGSIFGTQSTQFNAKGKGKATNFGRSSGRNPQVLLISLKSGATGLNLTVANHLFLMDPWWQEAIESQAIDRVNRIGQKKEVQVYQMITTNTVESRVLDIQARKKAMIDQAGVDFIELFGLKREGGRVKLKDDNQPKRDEFIVDDEEELDWVPTRTRGKEKRQEIPVDSD
ncbi:SWI/SNF-related matrix-associated actin-dependent regulator of chromatin subfamily A member 3-like 3 [Ceratobasidium sp. AG-Ba]|nr:SWI/SNF-related matrix-associated actin-dependent regulator of chromatin subfamily A member 3-like 3 [Ceratobasidium sp. AG-Ba]